MPSSAASYLYFFWHRPQSAVDVPFYEASLTKFQTALRALPYVTDLGTARLSEPPFPVPAADPSGEDDTWWYEDWYGLEDWSGLEALNRDAVATPMQDLHARIATPSRDGRGGLYAFASGRPSSGAGTQSSLWLRKPEGLSYAGFHTALEPLLAMVGGSLWRRVMVLGPAPEFLLTAAVPLPSLPWQGFGPPTLPRRSTPV